MKKIFEKTKFTPLFSGIDFEDFESLFACLSARTAFYKKNDVVMLSGGKVDFVGLILSGGVRIIKEDVEGNIAILTELSELELFGEVFACAGIEKSPVTVQASADCEVLFIDYKKKFYHLARPSVPFITN